MYYTIKELLEEAERRNLALWEVILENEKICTQKEETFIWAEQKRRYHIMKDSAAKALASDRIHLKKNLISGMAKRQNDYADIQNSLCGEFLNKVMARALSCSETNASMGKICAAPTAGACGILPAVLVSLEEKYQCPEAEVLKGLLTAAGIGAVIVKNATVSGAEGGCQAECGVAAAMAGAAAAYLAGGSNEMQTEAVALALINVMGLVCDPVAGLVQVPCAQRNASQAVNALLSADLALAGTRSLIPVDEVVEAMYKTGRLLPCELKETALGGIAATATGKNIAKQVLG